MDASALIDLGERHYPERLPLFRPIWDYLYEGIDSGNIISVDFVKTELERLAADWRQEFYIKSASMFLISQQIEQHYGQIVQEIESSTKFLRNRHRHRFFSGADPWVIALSRGLGRDSTVISAEKKPLNEYGLGAVCNELGIRHINLIKFFEENNIGH